jgi:hypothetical protein
MVDLNHFEDISDTPISTDNDSAETKLTPITLDEFGAPVFKSIDEAIRQYVERRDTLSRYMAGVKIYEEAAKEELSKISMWLRDKGDELGIDSFKTQYGTAYRSIKVSYRMGDWESFISWVKENNAFQCLEKRVAKNATKEIHDETGEVPPGINYVAEVEFDVRRPIKPKAK